jgi:hypothetical protein
MGGMKRLTLAPWFALLVLPVLAIGSSACGGGTPPPKTAEEPIDTKSSPAGQSANPNNAAANDGAGSSDPSAAGGSTASSAADPSAGLTGPAGAGSTTAPAGKGGKPPKGGKEAAVPAGPPPKTGPIINAADCAKLTDKYVELVISGEGAPLRGTSGKDLVQAREMVKAAAASDPNFINMQKACVKEIHRSQFQCGMDARSAAEWQDCIR